MAWRRPIQSVICAFLLLCVAVKVYVKVLNNSPFLVCMDVDIAQKETIDPFYLWIGPDGRNLKGHSNVNLTETGKLMLMAFDTSMSGSYSCTLSYKTIKLDVTHEKENFRSYNFEVLAYREPDYMYQVNIRYRAKPCHHSANLQFIENLLRIITEIIASLNCQMKNTFHKCHVIKAPEHSLQNELFISFKVNPFPHSWEKECIGDCEEETNRHTLKARDVIEEFFKLQPRVLEEEFEDVPEINYIEHSLGIVRVDTCRPGFGKNEITHNDCSGCCVVCDPGTYSSDNSVRCEVCKDIQITYFGATAC
ncbi:zona pellucida-binding protein 2 isoform X2 [Mixophyes fleayi]|uniref:zona pellucida-binding protein 2 isoform X2 n=1 Tax=Mixophyes fleayi TaxID=3061075 RepID=UPI003F4E1FDB